MVKDVLLTLVSVKYSGKSIGDDIRIEWAVLGESNGFNKKIKNGTTKQFNKKIGTFTVDQSSFTLSITLKIIERDIILNDIGAENIRIKVDLSKSVAQTSIHKISVLESRWKYKRPEAFFDVTLEVKIVDSIRYVKEQEKGWLTVKMDDGTVESLPDFLKIQFEYSENKREYFTILEGAYQGGKASVKFDKNGKSFLIAGEHHTSPAKMFYSISKKMLQVNGKRYETKDYPEFPWKKGFYDIEIPDAPHKGGIGYLTFAKKATVWFRVGHNGDRYIHTGRASLGCITLIEHKKWDSLYSMLIKSRKGDSVSIGTLEVID